MGKSKKLFSLATVLFTMMLFFLPVVLTSYGKIYAAAPDNYTARMVMNTFSMDFVRMGKKTRVDNPMLKGMITISIPEESKTITIFEPGKTYFEQSFNYKEGKPTPIDIDVVMEKRKAGTDRVDGHPTTRYEVTYYHKSNPGKKYNATIWEANDIGGLIIRYEMSGEETNGPAGKSRPTMELKDIRIGGAKSAMFEVPQRFRKASSMQELMGAGGGYFMPQGGRKSKGHGPNDSRSKGGSDNGLEVH
ncbi:MAG: hypothetical protein HQK89_16080 [Nitrospirae bacterium]|nr:hypothetical protein [Nitrospirota bacterium]